MRGTVVLGTSTRPADVRLCADARPGRRSLGPLSNRLSERLTSKTRQGLQWRIHAASVDMFEATVKDLKKLGAEKAPGRYCTKEEIANEMAAIIDFGKEQGKNVLVKEFMAGEYKGVVSTEQYAASIDGRSCLGKMSMNNWEPAEDETYIDDATNYRGQPGGDQFYRTEVDFTITKNGLRGRSVLCGAYELDEDDDSKFTVKFHEFKLCPASSDAADMKAWKGYIGPHNPTMGDDGVVTTPFEKSPKSWLKFVCMENDLQFLQSQAGTFIMLQRAG